MQVNAYSCASWKSECFCAILSRNRCAVRFCHKDLQRSLNLNTRLIWTLSPPLVTLPYPFRSEYMMHMRRAALSALFSSDGQQPLSRAGERDVCPPNDRHRFSSQTFLRQLRREKNGYCDGLTQRQVGRQRPQTPANSFCVSRHNSGPD